MSILRWTLLLWLGIFAPIAAGMAAAGHRCDSAGHTGFGATARHADHAIRYTGAARPGSHVEAHHQDHGTAHAQHGAGGHGDHSPVGGDTDRAAGDCCGDARACALQQCAVPANPALGAPPLLQPPTVALAQSYPVRQSDRVHPGHDPDPLRPPA